MKKTQTLLNSEKSLKAINSIASEFATDLLSEIFEIKLFDSRKNAIQIDAVSPLPFRVFDTITVFEIKNIFL